MLAARSIPDLKGLLERTNASQAAKKSDDDIGGGRLPASFPEIADLLTAHRAVLEAGDIFPASLIEQFIAILRS